MPKISPDGHCREGNFRGHQVNFLLVTLFAKFSEAILQLGLPVVWSSHHHLVEFVLAILDAGPDRRGLGPKTPDPPALAGQSFVGILLFPFDGFELFKVFDSKIPCPLRALYYYRAKS